MRALQFPYTAGALVYARDKDSGEVYLGADGLPRIKYWPSAGDRASMMKVWAAPLHCRGCACPSSCGALFTLLPFQKTDHVAGDKEGPCACLSCDLKHCLLVFCMVTSTLVVSSWAVSCLQGMVLGLRAMVAARAVSVMVLHTGQQLVFEPEYKKGDLVNASAFEDYLRDVQQHGKHMKPQSSLEVLLLAE